MAPVAAPRIDRPTYERLARRARLLSWLSLAWMTVEGAVAISAGLVASSIALVGFGLDSAIEGFASLVIVWRFTGSRMFSHAAETRGPCDLAHADSGLLLRPMRGRPTHETVHGGGV